MAHATGAASRAVVWDSRRLCLARYRLREQRVQLRFDRRRKLHVDTVLFHEIEQTLVRALPFRNGCGNIIKELVEFLGGHRGIRGHNRTPPGALLGLVSRRSLARSSDVTVKEAQNYKKRSGPS